MVYVVEYRDGAGWHFYGRLGKISPWYALQDALSCARTELRKGAQEFAITHCPWVDGQALIGSEEARIVREGKLIEEAR